MLKYIKVMGSLVEKGKMLRTQAGAFNERVILTVEQMKVEQAQRSKRATQGHQNRKSSYEQIQELTAAVRGLRRGRLTIW